MAGKKHDYQNSATFTKGDSVRWDSRNGEVKGKIIKKLTTETQIKGHTAKATTDDPQYLVQSNKTGAEAAHKPDELREA